MNLLCLLPKLMNITLRALAVLIMYVIESPLTVFRIKGGLIGEEGVCIKLRMGRLNVTAIIKAAFVMFINLNAINSYKNHCLDVLIWYLVFLCEAAVFYE